MKKIEEMNNDELKDELIAAILLSLLTFTDWESDLLVTLAKEIDADSHLLVAGHCWLNILWGAYNSPGAYILAVQYARLEVRGEQCGHSDNI